MLTCKQVSNSLNKKDYKDLPLVQRVLLKFHVRCCLFCGKYNKQVMETQDMCRHFRENEDSIIESADSEISLNDDKKELLKEKIAQSMDC
jgi:F0F1-type ATP synthase alpha subunit